MAKILLKFRDKIVREIPIFKDIMTIGRTDENDIVIDNIGASRHHAQVVREGDGYFVEDTESANGTILNGNVLSHETVKKSKLEDQDEITIGKHRLIFLLHAEVTEEDLAINEQAKKHSPLMMSAEETVHISGIKTKGYRRLTPSGLKTEIKDAGVEIIEGGEGVIQFTRILTVAGKGPTADIHIKGNYEKDVLFVISKRPEGYYLSPPKDKESPLKVDGKDVKDHTKLRNGQIIESEETRMKFFITFG